MIFPKYHPLSFAALRVTAIPTSCVCIANYISQLHRQISTCELLACNHAPNMSPCNALHSSQHLSWIDNIQVTDYLQTRSGRDKIFGRYRFAIIRMRVCALYVCVDATPSAFLCGIYQVTMSSPPCRHYMYL